MNIITETDKVFEAMTKMEGEKWATYQVESPYNDGDTFFYGLYNELKELVDMGDGSVENLPDDFYGAIYGAGGWNRYPVRCNGEVCFSSYHCEVDENLKQAKRLGFEII